MGLHRVFFLPTCRDRWRMASISCLQGGRRGGPIASFLENRWWIPFAACLGIMVGIASVLVLPFGVFIKPVSEEFGWSRAAMSSAPAISALFTIFSTPLQGRLLDHFGYRRVMLPGFILFALFMSCLALISGPIWQFYVIYAVTSFVGALSGPVAYSKAVASWFDRERGLALGIATSGAAPDCANSSAAEGGRLAARSPPRALTLVAKLPATSLNPCPA